MSDWWRDAVIYQVYPRSWADADGDGIGDLRGIAARLPHLVELGVDAVWFSPFYRSPQHDAGYDVADYRDVDPVFGTLADVDAVLREAAELGIKVIVDLVPNHTSSEHPWFREALASPPGSPARERYVFRDGKGPDGAQPPNDWRSVFGGQAWTRLTGPDGAPEQWYLHLFDTTQPDLNWEHPQVRAEFESIIDFWLDRGVAGFRVDVAHSLVKAEGLPDFPDAPAVVAGSVEQAPYFDQDGVHEIYRRWRALLDARGEPARIMCAEAWVTPAERAARYIRPDEFHQAFNFDILECPWRAEHLRTTIADSLAATSSVRASATWVLSNHDVVRHASRLGLPPGTPRPQGIGPGDPRPDPVAGLARARAATLLVLSLPGAAYLYQGEELGLPEAMNLPPEVRQDPIFERSGGTDAGRDGCRVPMAWEADAPALGFSPSGASWLPQPHEYRDLAVDRQRGVAGTTYEMYRAALRIRRETGLGSAAITPLDLGPDVVAYEHACPDGVVLGVTNLGAEPVDLPDGEVLLRSDTGTAQGPAHVGTDVTVWVRRE